MDNESRYLVIQFQEGQHDAAEEIFSRYVRRLIGLARSHLSPQMRGRVDAEDIVQSAYGSFFRRATNDDIRLEHGGDLWRLLAGITVNKVRGKVEFHMAQKRAVTREVRPADNQSTMSLSRNAIDLIPDASDLIAAAEELQAVTNELEPLQQQILELRLNGEEVTAIGREVNRTERTIRRTLNMIRDRLERRLHDNCS